MNNNKTILSILCLLIIVSTIFAGESSKNGTTAAQFLKIGVGARPMGMAGSYAAQSDDIYSLYWNPAGITKIKGISFTGVHTRWFADITHQFFGLVLPLNGSSSIGAHATVLNMDDIDARHVDRQLI